MPKTKFHIHPWLGMGLTLLAFGAAAAVPQAQVRAVTLDIKAQSIGSALNEFARQSGVQVLFYSDVSDGLSVPGIAGTFAPDEALAKLLWNTGLTFEYVNSRTVAIRRAISNVSEGAAIHGEPERLFMRLANVQIAETPNDDQQIGAAADTLDSDNDTRRIRASEEVIVTAQKRAERLIDVPQSVTVLSSDALAKLGALQFRDFANTVAGLTFTTTGAGSTQISLRGVTTGTDVSSTVGIYVDDVPYGSSSGFAAGSQLALDVGVFDLDRIEVLRGPQGALYGASTMGGLLKYVTKRPDATRFGVDAQTGISSTRDGGVSYGAAAVVNAPIVTDKVALRASGYYSRDGGYFDNLALGEKDVNRSDISGGRLDLLLTPTEALTIRIDGFLQHISRDGIATADYTAAGVPVDGSLDQRRPLAEPFHQRFQLVSGTVSYDLDWASLTSISSYQETRTDYVTDLSSIFVPLCPFQGSTCSAAGLAFDISTDKFTQEVRLASDGSRALEWLIGGFYTHETSARAFDLSLRDLVGQPLPNNLLTAAFPSRYQEYAAFGNLTWHLNSRFDVSGGLRYARNDQEFTQNGSGLFIESTPTRRSSEHVVTYLANARYHFSDHATGYLRYATGYRPGGPNFVANDPITGLSIAPDTFEADELKSYEAGFKVETADRRFGVDLAAYYIDWSNIQILAFRNGFSVFANAPGGATARGAELTLTARPTSGLAMTGAFGYNNRRLSETATELGGQKGEELPGTSRFTAALSADYTFQGEGLRPTIGATLRHVPERTSSFSNAPTQLPPAQAYTTLDLRTGFVLSSVDLQFYVHNLFDERGELAVGIFSKAIMQPRTIGVSARMRF